MKDGSIAANGKPEAVLSNEEVIHELEEENSTEETKEHETNEVQKFFSIS